MDQPSGLMKSISDLEHENEILRQEQFNIDYKMALLYKRLDTLEQKSLLNYVEIISIPEFTNEDCYKVVEQIGADLGVQLSVINAMRLCSDIPTKTNRIVAEFSTYEQKRQLIESSKNNQFIDRIEGNVGRRRVFINDFLTEFNRLLLYKTREFAKQNGFKYVWYSDCKIFMKKYEYSTVFLIQNEFDLFRIHFDETYFANKLNII